MAKGLCNVSGASVEELINFLVFYNGTKYAVDKFVPTSNIEANGNTGFNYSLNEEPKGIVFIANNRASEDYILAFLLSTYEFDGVESSYIRRGDSYYFSSSYGDLLKVVGYVRYITINVDTQTKKITVNVSDPSLKIFFGAGIEYTLITIA